MNILPSLRRNFYSTRKNTKLSKSLKEMGFPGGLVVKKLPANAGDIRDAGLIT